MAIVLYNLAVRFRDELIDPLEHIGRSRMSDPIISFDDARIKEVLATYTVGRNALGLKDEITFNTAQYKDNEYGKNDDCSLLLETKKRHFQSLTT